ncbi:DUF4426 domain-containing protein [Teredinibacter haidensis]|uniref:DUF4426 domain-containing protein n=1 Tax=Teredinibacter haidensis TaxID=2731755 RepID=UPI0009491C44|nr:DUF4426 domain-containing protein [Teredinibacter haidensis]
MKIFNCLLFLLFTSAFTWAQPSSQGSQAFDQHEVHYSVFPSTFLLPEVAAAYKIKRSKYESLVNISVSPTGQYGGLTAKITGTVTNLMQQQKKLSFLEIREGNTTYYIAPVRISGEELVRFKINVQIPEKDSPFITTFSTKLVAQ